MIPPLAVYGDEAEVGWEGGSRPLDAAARNWPVIPAQRALFDPHETAACTVGYLLPLPRPMGDVVLGSAGYEEAQPRINKGALPACIQNDQEPLMCWVFVDLDNAGHAKWRSPEEGADKVRERIALGGILMDSAGWYLSESGFRLVWRLPEPIPVTKYKDWCSQFLKMLERHLRTGFADAKTGQGGIDLRSGLWTQVFRLPRITKEGRTEPLNLPMNLKPLWTRTLDWSPPRKTLLREPLTLPSAGDWVSDDLPFEGKLPGTAEVPSELWGQITNAACSRAAYRGEPLAEKGNRDNALMKSIGEIVMLLSALGEVPPPDLVYAMLARSVAAWINEDGAPTLKKLWTKCQEICGRHKAQHEAQKVFQNEKVILVYTADGSTYYVWNEKEQSYEPPIRGHGPLAAHLQDPRLGLEALPGMVVRNEKGKLRELGELIANYGHVAHRVIAVYGLEKSYYDMRTKILYTSAAPMSDVQPVLHGDVLEWFTLLGGQFADKFLDWLATIRQVTRPTVAVYLESVPGAGKGMLASGIARMWQGAAPCSYKEAHASFNEKLMRCPLVLLDEGLGDERAWSTQFRAFLGASEYELRIKHHPTMDLQGCIRLLIAANGEDALKLRERFGANDLQAIADRILHIKTGMAPREYLIGLGGREATDDWVKYSDGSPGKIAETLAWLEQNRFVEPGSRFLVESVPSEWHMNLSTHGQVGEVLECIAHMLMSNSKDPAFARKDGLLYVNANIVRDRWVMVMKAAPPTMVQIGSALRAVAPAAKSEKMRVGQSGSKVDIRQMWGVDPAKVLHNAQQRKIDDGTLASRLDGTHVQQVKKAVPQGGQT